MPMQTPDLAFRSLDTGWNRARWEELPADGKRYEVIEGILYATTTPSVFHQWVIRQLVLFVLAPAIDQAGVGVTLWAPIGVFMPPCDPVQPDVLVVRTEDLGIIHDTRVFGVPALIVEVLSPSNEQEDTQIKRRGYALAGLPEYWIVRPSTRDVEICSEPDQMTGTYCRSMIVARDAVLRSPTLPIQANVAVLFAGAPDTTL